MVELKNNIQLEPPLFDLKFSNTIDLPTILKAIITHLPSRLNVSLIGCFATCFVLMQTSNEFTMLSALLQ